MILNKLFIYLFIRYLFFMNFPKGHYYWDYLDLSHSVYSYEFFDHDQFWLEQGFSIVFILKFMCTFFFWSVTKIIIRSILFFIDFFMTFLKSLYFYFFFLLLLLSTPFTRVLIHRCPILITLDFVLLLLTHLVNVAWYCKVYYIICIQKCNRSFF